MKNADPFKTLTDNLLDPCGIFSSVRDDSGKITDFKIEYLNEAAIKSNKMPRKDQIGKLLCEVFPAHKSSGLFEEYCQVVESGIPLRKELLNYEDYFGTEKLNRAYLLSSVKLGDGFACSWVEMTEIKERENELRENYERYRFILENSEDVIWTLDYKTGRFTSISNSVEKMRGYSPQEALSETVEEAMTPESFKKISDAYQAGIAGRKSGDASVFKFSSLIDQPCRDGSIVSTEVVSTLVYDEKGEPQEIIGVSRDISERLGNEKKLKLLNRAIEQSPAIVVITDIDGNIEYVNPRFTTLTGYSKEEAIGQNPRILKSGNQTTDFYKELWETILSGNDWRGEFENRRKDGSLYWESAIISPVHDDRGEITAFVAVKEDITERKRIHEEMILAKEGAETNEIKLKEAQKISHVGSWYYDVELQKPVWSDEMFRIWGLENKTEAPEYLEHKKYIHPDDWELFDNAVQEAVEHGTPYNLELRICRPDGIEKTIISICQPVFEEENRVFALKGTNQDITERKKYEQALIENENKFRALHENAGVGVAYYSPEGKVISYNLLAAKHMHGNPEDFEGKSIYDIFPEEEATIYHNRIKEAAAANDPTVFEDYVHLPTGRRYFISTFTKICDINKNILGIQVVSQDISDRKNIELELIEAKEKAEENDRLKTAFLANMSHEIRTPLNGILGFSDILQTPDIAVEDQKEYLKLLRSSGERMLNTINSILEIAKIESGEITMNISDFDLNELLNYLHSFFLPEATTKGISLIITNDIAANPLIINSDREKLLSILINLIKNAIKFTSSGGIEISYKVENKILCFAIKDSGMGISPQKLEKVFERFVQEDSSNTRAFEGTGLGLTISKTYAKLIGGWLGVESEPGHGSTFYLSIPYNYIIEKADNPSEEEKTKFHDLKTTSLVLIVEDDDLNFTYMQAAFKKFRIGYIRVKTGEEAVQLCRENSKIELVMMDIRLPDMNGYEATRQIRKFNSIIPIIAQTAYAFESDRDEALLAGCNDYISKPIRMATLSELVNKYLNNNLTDSSL